MTFTLNPGQQRAFDNVLTSGARFNLLYGGSRSGKTALFCSCIMDRSLYAPGSRHLIARQEGTAAKRSIAKDTFPAIWAKKFPDSKQPVWREQYGYFEIGNGSEVWVGGLNDAKALEKLLGNEYATIFCNELSEQTYNAHTLLRSRLAQKVPTIDGGTLSQRFYGDLNPTTKMHWTYRLWVDGVDPEDETEVDVTRYSYAVINPIDNIANHDADFLADLDALPERARKRFRDGEYSADDDKALWNRKMFKRVKAEPGRAVPEHVEITRIVVAIDPAISANQQSDETGIVAVGLSNEGNAYVMADESGKYKPEEWARKAVALYHSLNADRIIGEVNQGGDMVESVIRAVNADIPYRAVRASKGKYTRAEPIAALYERGKVFHVGEFPALEDQMCAVTPGFDGAQHGWSPDRVDALVWAVTDLFPQLTVRQETSGPLPAPQFSMV